MTCCQDQSGCDSSTRWTKNTGATRGRHGSASIGGTAARDWCEGRLPTIATTATAYATLAIQTLPRTRNDRPTAGMPPRSLSPLPRLPVRQWVLSLPKRLRYHLQHDRKALNSTLRIVLDAVGQHLRSRCPGTGPKGDPANPVGAGSLSAALADALGCQVRPCGRPLARLGRDDRSGYAPSRRLRRLGWDCGFRRRFRARRCGSLKSALVSLDAARLSKGLAMI